MEITGTIKIEVSDTERKRITVNYLWDEVITLTGISDWCTDIVTDTEGNTYFGNDGTALVSTNPKVALLGDTINTLTLGYTIKIGE